MENLQYILKQTALQSTVHKRKRQR